MATAGGDVSAGGGELAAGGGELSAGGGELAAGGGELAGGGGELAGGGGELAAGGGEFSAGGGELAAGGGELAAGGGVLSAGGGELAGGGGGFGAAGVAGGAAGVFAGGAASDVAMVGRSREKERRDGREHKRKAAGAGATRGARRCQTKEERQPRGPIEAPSPRKDIGLRPNRDGLHPDVDGDNLSFLCIEKGKEKHPEKVPPFIVSWNHYCTLVPFQAHQESGIDRHRGARVAGSGSCSWSWSKRTSDRRVRAHTADHRSSSALYSL